MKRKLAVISTGYASGRGSEAAYITISKMDWDSMYDCVIVELPQSKVDKWKLCMFTAGVNQ